MSTRTDALRHLRHKRVGDELRSLGPDHEDRADHDVRCATCLFDCMRRGGDRLEPSPEVVVDLAQPFEVAVENEDARMHPYSHGCGRHAGDARPENHHVCRPNPWDPADEHSPVRHPERMR